MTVCPRPGRRARWWRAGVRLAALGFACALLPACDPPGRRGTPGNPSVVVLGFDGADPRDVERGLKEGRLPALARLAGRGRLMPLGTTTPPQSPVAWSTFATGLRPGAHGVLGTTIRDATTYAPRSGVLEIEPPTFFAGFAVYGPSVRSRRTGATFWEIADRHGVGAAILRAPFSLPIGGMTQGRVLAGEGVPDLRGSRGGFTLFTTSDPAPGSPPDGVVVPVSWTGDRIESALPGLEIGGIVGAEVPLRIARAGMKLRIEIASTVLELTPGDWSGWVPVRFPVTRFDSVPGLCRVHLASVEPDLRLVFTSPAYDPSAPYVPISSPASFAVDLARSVGAFGTSGWSAPTAALDAGVIDEEAFLASVLESLKEQRRILLQQIDQRDAELVVAVFDEPDRITHMFHRYVDPRSPLYDSARAARFGNVIDRAYDAMDQIVESVLEHLPEESQVLVLSDHGFHAFDRGVNLNTWLEREGWMVRSAGRESDRATGFAGVDWSRTRAYSLGVGQLYLNLRGREALGVVEPGEPAAALVESIRGRLLDLRDGASDTPVVVRADPGAVVFAGPFAAEAPDLQIAFAPGYRSSFATEVGGSRPAVIEQNETRWSGDHSGSSEAETPGFLATSFPFAGETASLLDVAPTVLSLLGVPRPDEMEGRVLH